MTDFDIDPDLVEPGHVIFRTNNSVYEIDQDQKLIRRLFGDAPNNSKHMPVDLEWAPYYRVIVSKGFPAAIYWSEDEVRRLSTVRDIFGTLIEAPPCTK